MEQGTQGHEVHQRGRRRRPNEAQNYGFTGTPSFAIKGPSTNGIELLGSLSAPEEFEEAIEEAS